MLSIDNLQVIDSIEIILFYFRIPGISQIDEVHQLQKVRHLSMLTCTQLIGRVVVQAQLNK